MSSPTLDRMVLAADRLLRALTGTAQADGEASRQEGPSRPSPAGGVIPAALDEHGRRESVALIRVNHCGEVCAQALYRGQLLTAMTPETQALLRQAAAEEEDHLRWCAQRLEDMGGRPSYLNPMWYGLSLSLGALVGLAGDRISLGFIAATEEQVCEHL